jgi:lipoprotein-releasing system permease protein
MAHSTPLERRVSVLRGVPADPLADPRIRASRTPLNLPYEWQVGLRYTRAGKRKGEVDHSGKAGDGFVSFIAAISMAGIALGVAALIIVLSVMNGFQKDVRDRMLSVVSHVEVFNPDTGVADWQALAADAERVPEVRAAAPYVQGQAMLTRDDVVRGVVIRGVEPADEAKVSDLATEMVAGKLADLTPGSFNIVLGSALARELGVRRGDKINVLAPQGIVTPAGMVPRLKAFTVSGVFESGHYEYDSTLALIDLDDGEKLYRLSNPTGIRLRLSDMQEAPDVSRKLLQTLRTDVIVRDWTKENASWFAAVQLEKRMMFIILVMISAVAAFGLVSSLVMSVRDKEADIAILRTLGAAPKSIMAIFVVQGAMIGVAGCAIGIVGGLLIAINVGSIVAFIEQLFHVAFLPQNIYFVSRLPSDVHEADVITIAVVSVLLSFIATLYPSWRASRVQPAQALRYE